MKLLSHGGRHVYVADAPIWEPDSPTLQGRDHLLIGVMKKTLTAHAARGLSVYIGQLFGIVGPGLIFARHLFRGVKRPLMVGDDKKADGDKLIATWEQTRDVVLEGGPQSARLVYHAAPKSRVFVVLISRNKMLEEFPQIYGWAEHWTWVAADPDEPGAPIDWQTRYEERLWVAPKPGA